MKDDQGLPVYPSWARGRLPSVEGWQVLTESGGTISSWQSLPGGDSSIPFLQHGLGLH